MALYFTIANPDPSRILRILIQPDHSGLQLTLLCSVEAGVFAGQADEATPLSKVPDISWKVNHGRGLRPLKLLRFGRPIIEIKNVRNV